MKRNSLMKGYSYKSSTKESSTYVVNCYNKNQMAKDLIWESHNNNGDHHEDYMNGFPWPPRSYNCSFCRKEFKSAQALGGHMNVHRRDRARLRQSPPNDQGQAHMLNLNLDPITNPNNSNSSMSLLPSSSAPLKHVTSTLPLFVSPTPSFSPPSASHSSELKRWLVVDGIGLLNHPLSTKRAPETTKSKISAENIGEYDHAFAGEDHGCKMLKKGEILRMDLEIGLPRDYDLDLELRLGTYS
ncbi:hypothetical protein VNO77_28147 [Canavalia gladiata]|uniref:C2H2-type domain-containing protein n=1 Tax=Canavalia gladiata TaxID=3824 RepID=A0AAN9KYG1_CANGL